MEFHQQKGELSIEFRNMARLYSDILLCNEFRRFYPYILLSMKIRNMPRFYLYILFSIEFRNVARFYPYILFSIEFKDTARFYPYTLLSIEFRDIARFHSYFFWNKLKVTDALKKEIGNKFNLGNIIYPCIIIILNI